METYALPLGTKVPSLTELRRERGLDALRTAARVYDDERLALETVGPAARYAPLARSASAVAPPPPATRSVAGGPVRYPDPARTMSLAECAKGLGKSRKFYLKSRFAVCSGASFVQTWLRNGRLSGRSMFNVRVIGTIPDNSRTITFRYYVTDVEKTGTTGASGMPIRIKGQVAKSWPARARYTHGGTIPATARTFSQLGRLRTFTHTVRAAPGGGRTAADLVHAVYEPTVSITPTPGWTMGPGSTGGKLFLLAPRWDAARYLGNATGGGKPANKGAATFSYTTALAYSGRPGAVERAVALHIRDAYADPAATKPPNTAKKLPGQSVKDPLHRLYTNTARRKANRAKAIAHCRAHFGAGYTAGGKQCDEFPFATTYEGCAQKAYEKNAASNNCSVRPLVGGENRNAGILLSQFYTKNRIIDGYEDGFTMHVRS
ncbi:NucA/NucB deoxyribonuclease domain-containing protein [Streptomyces sp. N35]|uniref:NucA/NucB deoxyribonuclease domain-containing protein n=1 Tax=Streptomyces sp. N35 TaxID=2795730 RepID=UPI0018F3331C|nr:NucA/NucB deoxyribonuclease domain-containing protein [Streptomyces sp. N35]